MTLEYYFPELGLNGTTDQFLTELQNFYIDSSAAAYKVAELLRQEGRDDDAFLATCYAERIIANADPSIPWNFGSMKVDILTANRIIEDEYEYDANGFHIIESFQYEPSNETILYCVQQINDTQSLIGSAAMSKEEFLQATPRDMCVFMGHTTAYNMIEEEIEID